MVVEYGLDREEIRMYKVLLEQVEEVHADVLHEEEIKAVSIASIA